MRTGRGRRTRSPRAGIGAAGGPGVTILVCLAACALAGGRISSPAEASAIPALEEAASPDHGYGTAAFPCPPELRPRVNFWIRVFTEFSSDVRVLHDARYPWIIYDVVPVQGLSEKTASRTIEARRTHYERILDALPDKNPQTYTPEERRVADLLAGVPDVHLRGDGKDRVRAQAGVQESMASGLARSGRYLQRIIEIFDQMDVPREIAYLPHLESSFEPAARSRAGAVGLWQFTRATGRKYLRIENDLDERRDPIASTLAAARFLREAKEKLGSWPLAVVGYNHGVNGMLRAKDRLGSTDIVKILREYDAPSFGFASENFYCEFLAVVEIGRNPTRYFSGISFAPPIETVDFPTRHFVKLSALAEAFRVPKHELAQLNPALGRSYLHDSRAVPRGYILRLPPRITDPGVLYASIPASERFDREPRPEGHEVEPGETLERIARRYRVSVSTLCDLNGIRDADRIYAGQMLVLP